ncbi:MAG: T9SS type A sorting domain-containing protein [Saprospiraceae bacterium]|nr:T9SS type A sorting domain-containing protein [Saprospiraceae bacterium]
MKTLISKIAFILLLQGFAGTLLAHVELDYPVGGETFNPGQSVTIQWHIAIAHNTLNWDLLFSADGGSTWEAIQMDLPAGSLSYNWIVPSNITSQARVSVIQDNSGLDYQDESLNFNIVLPAMPPAIITGATNLTIESNPVNQDDLIQDWLDNHGGASANGFCGDLVWTNNYLGLSNGCGSTGTALVAFTATDPCGSTETVATVTVSDTSPPVLNTPSSPLVVECDGNGNLSQFNTWVGMNGGATASDVGGSLSWIASLSDQHLGCGLNRIISMLFTAVDECNNTVATSATFTTEDHTAPDIQGPAQDIVIECGQPNAQAIFQNWLLNSGGAIAMDFCATVTWSNNFPLLPDTCNGTITSWTVEFTANDDCGNTNATSATITFNDALSGTSGSLSLEPGFTISPNPVSDILKVEFTDDAFLIERITLFDALGHPVKVFQEKTKEMFFPVDGFVPGLYYLQAQTSHGVGIRKVVIE